MAVRIDLAGEEYSISGYKWSGPDETVVKLLDVMLDPDGPPGWEPFPDHAAAQEIAEKLGGEITGYDEPTPLPEGVIS